MSSSTEVNSYSPFPPLQNPTPRKRESPARARPKSRYEYIKANRYSTQAPFLSILPIQYSLTEGTAIPAPTQLDTPPQTPTKEAHYTPITPPNITSPIFGAFAGPLSSHPISPIDATVEESFAHLFVRPESCYSNVATFGRPSESYDEYRGSGIITPPPSAPPSGAFHSHRPSVISRLFSRRSTRSSTASSSPSMSSVDSPTFHRSNQSTNTLGSSTRGHYHPNGGTCAFCDPSASTSTWPTRGMRRAASTYSFQTTMKRNTTIYAGDFAEPASATDYTSASKSATFPRMMRKKSIDVLKRKSQGWFRDLEAEEEEEAARQRALVAAREKEREAEMREIRERAERRTIFEEEDEEEEEDRWREPPPRLPELSLVSESEEEDGFDVLFGGIGR